MKFDPQDYDPANFPSRPGIYFMYGEDDKVLYIGKAKRIRNRLTHHVTIYERRKPLLPLLDEDIGADDLGWVVYNVETTTPIDLFLEKVERVETVEMPFESAEIWEKLLIEKLNPPFNKEYVDGYDSEDYDKLLERTQKVKREKIEPARHEKVREAFSGL